MLTALQLDRITVCTRQHIQLKQLALQQLQLHLQAMTSGKSLANQEQAGDSKTVFLIGIAVLCCTARRFSCELQPSQDQVVPKE